MLMYAGRLYVCRQTEHNSGLSNSEAALQQTETLSNESWTLSVRRNSAWQWQVEQYCAL